MNSVTHGALERRHRKRVRECVCAGCERGVSSAQPSTHVETLQNQIEVLKQHITLYHLISSSWFVNACSAPVHSSKKNEDSTQNRTAVFEFVRCAQTFSLGAELEWESYLCGMSISTFRFSTMPGLFCVSETPHCIFVSSASLPNPIFCSVRWISLFFVAQIFLDAEIWNNT